MSKCPVQVCVRVRSFLPHEDAATGSALAPQGRDGVIMKRQQGDKKFKFNRVFWPRMPHQGITHAATQEDVFAEVGTPLLQSVMSGYNGCVFAYGQTGSGKTHTMFGNENQIGFIPRFVDNLFAALRDKFPTFQTSTEPGTTRSRGARVRMSLYEIYNEKVMDLLSDTHKRRRCSLPMGFDGEQARSCTPPPGAALEVHWKPKRGAYVRGLKRHDVASWDEVHNLLTQGLRERATATTKMNAHASRSHAIVELYVEQVEAIGGNGGGPAASPLAAAHGRSQVRAYRTSRSRVFLVDLAGSERLERSGVEGDTKTEAIKINLSLTQLRLVIQQQTSGAQHISYRNSPLTFLLQHAIGGNAKTFMIATVSPCTTNADETVSTLEYANLTKRVVNEARVNEEFTAGERKELAQLRRQSAVLQHNITSLQARESMQQAEAIALKQREEDYRMEICALRQREAMQLERLAEMEARMRELEARHTSPRSRRSVPTTPRTPWTSRRARTDAAVQVNIDPPKGKNGTNTNDTRPWVPVDEWEEDESNRVAGVHPCPDADPQEFDSFFLRAENARLRATGLELQQRVNAVAEEWWRAEERACDAERRYAEMLEGSKRTMEEKEAQMERMETLLQQLMQLQELQDHDGDEEFEEEFEEIPINGKSRCITPVPYTREVLVAAA